MKYRILEDGSVPVLFCERQRRWLPMEEHLDCEFCAAPVFDENGAPVSFICTNTGERREFQPGYLDPSEEGRGPVTPPADPDLVPPEE